MLEAVTTAIGGSVSYLRALEGGRTAGAYLILPVDGPPAVLKFGGPSTWLVQIRQAAKTAEELGSVGYPTPRIWASGRLPPDQWWYLQDYVEGEVVAEEHFTPTHFEELLGLLRRNRELAPTTRQDWSRYVVDLVFGHDHDWTVLEATGPEVRAFLDGLSQRVEPLRRVVLRDQDLVLGDPGPHNLIFRDGRIVAAIDFECAGRGDSLIDAVSLMARFRDRPQFLDALLGQEFTVGGVPAIRLCGAAGVLSGLNWHLSQGEGAPSAVEDAEEVLNFYWSLSPV